MQVEASAVVGRWDYLERTGAKRLDLLRGYHPIAAIPVQTSSRERRPGREARQHQRQMLRTVGVGQAGEAAKRDRAALSTFIGIGYGEVVDRVRMPAVLTAIGEGDEISGDRIHKVADRRCNDIA